MTTTTITAAPLVVFGLVSLLLLLTINLAFASSLAQHLQLQLRTPPLAMIAYLCRVITSSSVVFFSLLLPLSARDGARTVIEKVRSSLRRAALPRRCKPAPGRVAVACF